MISLSCCFDKDISRFSIICSKLRISSCMVRLGSPFFFYASKKKKSTTVHYQPMYLEGTAAESQTCHFILQKWVCKAEAETTLLILTTGHLRLAKIMTLKCLVFSWTNGGSLFPIIKASALHIFDLLHTKRKTTHSLKKKRN